MADRALVKLEAQLQCSVCLDRYKDPKLLECFHIFCRECLVKLLMEEKKKEQERGGGSTSSSSSNASALPCPNCRQPVALPNSSGIEALRPAFHINQLLEIREELVAQKSLVHSGSNGVVGKEGAVRNKQENLYCAQHKGKEIELYCETCNELACLKCAVKGGKHQRHIYSFLGNESSKYKSDISSALEPVHQRAHQVKKALVQVEKRSEEVASQRKSLEDAVEESVRKVVTSIISRKAELLRTLHELTDDKLSLLASQKSVLESNYSHLAQCVEFVEAGIESDVPLKIVQMKTSIGSLVDSLMETIGNDIIEPVTEADIKFTGPLDNHVHSFRTFGGIYAFGSCDVTKSRASGSGLSAATVGEESKVFIHPVNFLGHPCSEPINNLRCELVSNLNGTKVKGNVERTRSDGRIELRYRPIVQGRHHLHVVIDNQPVPGSPFSVLVVVKVQNLSSSILNMKGAEHPWGLAVSVREDEVFVSDSERHCVSIFSRSLGGILRSFGTNGSSQGNFRSPRGIALDKNYHVFVVDSENHRVQKFTLDGKFIASVGTMGNNPLQFYYPKDIAYNSVNDRLYILDGNDQVQVLDTDFSLCAIFGKHGRENGQFNNPWGITCDSSGRVFVADTYNHRVQIFTAEKEFVAAFGIRGRKNGELCDPIGVAVDSSKGVIYISERQKERVSLFSVDGTFLSTSVGGGYKCGLAVDSDGLVYVCNTSKCEVQVY